MTPYETLRQKHVARAMALLPEHVSRLDWPAGRLAAERERRLRELLAVAKEKSSWHRERLAHADADLIREDDLPGLPVMTKDDLMAHFDEIVTDPRVTLAAANAHIETLDTDRYILDDLHAFVSGGSSGKRGVFVYGFEPWAVVYLMVARWSMRDRMTDPALAAVPLVTAVVAAENASHMTSALPQTFANPVMDMHRFPVTLPIPEIVEGLNRLQPTALGAYGSMLAVLVDEARAGHLKISPLRVTSTSEPLLPEVRTAAAETWGAPVVNMWGTSEGGIVGVGCGRGAGMHIADDLLVVEPVDEEGRPVPPGERSAKIYLTNLFNPLLPLIRYEITDQITLLDEPCPCGSQHRRIEDIQGRLDDAFVYGAGSPVHPHVFRSVLARDPHVVEYQVRQTAQGADVLVRSGGRADGRRLSDSLAAELRRAGLRDPVASVTEVARIERQASGKLKRFIPLS